MKCDSGSFMFSKVEFSRTLKRSLFSSLLKLKYLKRNSTILFIFRKNAKDNCAIQIHQQWFFFKCEKWKGQRSLTLYSLFHIINFILTIRLIFTSGSFSSPLHVSPFYTFHFKPLLISFPHDEMPRRWVGFIGGQSLRRWNQLLWEQREDLNCSFNSLTSRCRPSIFSSQWERSGPDRGERVFCKR